MVTYTATSARTSAPPSTAQPLLTAPQLGQLLRAARKQRGLTQAEVGARLGLSQNRVSHLEGHAEELSLKQLLTWCAVVGLELSLAERQGMAPGARGSQVQDSPAATPEW
ncbi:MAG TPA: helix-turn-helix domain-containing protein [Burkholderiaceae bacterium]|nr:helix-turn-helix domain-containing protein [Burkholderiaceae bacterium]